MKRLLSILLTAFGVLSCSAPVYDVVVVGGGPAGIGAALSWSYWMVDEHKAGTSGARLVFHEPEKVGTVPLGALLPKGVGNLLVAGRAISSDHGANSALRVQASCMGMGQAAGVVASLAASKRCDPREVPLEEIKTSLSGIGHLVPKE